MKRKIDPMGRLVIPKPLRETAGINLGDELEIYNEDNRIIIEKLNPCCALCGSEEELLLFKGRNLCKTCISEIKRY